jgi:hypothetical protein
VGTIIRFSLKNNNNNICYSDEHTLWKPSQSVEEIPPEAYCSAQFGYRSSEQFTASTVPSPRMWRPRSHSSDGSPN